MSLSISSALIGRWQRRLSRSGWLLADRFIRLGCGFFIGVAMARLLGPSNYGTFAYATALATLFLPVLSLGLERVVIRDLARFPEWRPVLLGTAVLLRFWGGLVSFALAVGCAVLLDGGGGTTRWLVAVIAAGNVFMAADVVDWGFQADGLFRLPVVVRLSCFVVGSAVRLWLAAAGAPLTAIAAAQLGEIALVSLMLFVSARAVRGAPLVSWRARVVVARDLLVVSWPLLVAEVGNWVFQRIDLLILNRHATEAELGCYSVALRVAQAGFFVPMIALQVLSPAAAQAGGPAAVLALVRRLMAILSTAGTGLAVAITACAPWAVPLLFGRQYETSVPLILVLAWSNVFVFIGCCHALYLVSTDQQHVSLRLTWVTAICSLSLNLLLIPRWHALGAAIAATGTCAMTSIFGVVLFPESRPLFSANLYALAAPFRLLSPAWWRGER